MPQFRLIQGIFRGLHGRDEYRLLFEDGAAGIFVWLTPDFSLKGFQASVDDLTYAVFSRGGSGVRFMSKTDQPFNESLSVADNSSHIVNVYSSAECDEFPKLFSMIRKLFVGQIPETFLLDNAEREAIHSREITDYMPRYRL